MTYNDERKVEWLRRLGNRKRHARGEFEERNLLQNALGPEEQEVAYWDFFDAWDRIKEEQEEFSFILYEFGEYLYALLGLPESFATRSGARSEEP